MQQGLSSSVLLAFHTTDCCDFAQEGQRGHEGTMFEFWRQHSSFRAEQPRERSLWGPWAARAWSELSGSKTIMKKTVENAWSRGSVRGWESGQTGGRNWEGHMMAVTLGRKHHKEFLEPVTECHSGQCKPSSQHHKPPLHHVYVNQFRSSNMLIWLFLKFLTWLNFSLDIWLDYLTN